jgi:hypothetical protein
MDRQRVIAILLEETAKVEERYPGYSDEMKACVAEIVELERQHKLVSRNIKQDVSAKIDAYARDLVRHQGEDAT